eukprot:gene21044-biopygen14614
MLLKRFAYPCRYSDLIPRFGRSKSEICLIVNKVMRYLSDVSKPLLTSFEQRWLQQDKLIEYCPAVHNKSHALENCWGFVDGTVPPICRPGENQKVVYNGHKRVHALKYQSVVAANGLVANLYGPVEGKSQDAGILRQSELLQKLEQHCTTQDGKPLCVYAVEDLVIQKDININRTFKDKKGDLVVACSSEKSRDKLKEFVEQKDI